MCKLYACAPCKQARKWVAQRAAGLQELTLRPRHAPSAGAIAPLWPLLAGSLRALDLSLERELPDCKPQVGSPAGSPSRGCK